MVIGTHYTGIGIDNRRLGTGHRTWIRTQAGRGGGT
jgi:hypothetical protein